MVQIRGETLNLKANKTERIRGEVRSIGVLGLAEPIELWVGGGEPVTVSESFFLELYDEDANATIAVMSPTDQNVSLILNARSAVQFNDLAKAIGGTQFAIDAATLLEQEQGVQRSVEQATKINLSTHQDPVDVTDAGQQIVGTKDARRETAFYNEGPNTVYIGGVNVTAANGFPLAMGEKMSVPGRYLMRAICAAGETGRVRILEASGFGAP